ncbi:MULTISPECIES: type I-C CRISPR-associated protein Cas7/Csd2 [Diplocloster]|uniref:Type I-C CRISPR-associated protein Cas7/Csd2 n=1 Tax=Diplocloster modestus TaxID=2850322 RepID=A0ABS6K660_9FIRM|nr:MULTISPECIES: type I-C CRISPR-associated protein Cas7/Csd2 [Diplocloster]MBU9725936.1 type I-C CRISPR-associated protein Cas7/Csd2 [Diplocloster modestus]MBU9742434.1 type I-C CRISPR-associated protein Cas7/Csd2 [Diplocloster agilis]
MSEFTNKIDFAVLVTVRNANPNGDPLNGNRPREDYDGFGEISDVCVKRKIRNRLQDMGEEIFVQSNDRIQDGYKSLSERAKNCEELAAALKEKNSESYAKAACEKWIDVRSFGQVFAFKDNNVSIGVRGPVSVHPGISVSPVDIVDLQITKSTNSEPSAEGKKSSDTMGMKHRVEFGLYVIKGSINHQLAEKTGFTDEDAEKIKDALKTLFENDCSAARPDGSMEVYRVYWWKHNCPAGQYSSAKVHRALQIRQRNPESSPRGIEDYEIMLNPLQDLEPEVYEGL